MADLMRTASEDVELAIREIEMRAPDLDARREGTLLNGLAGVMALMKRDAQRLALTEIAKTFVAAAQGADLDTLALDHYEMERQAAAKAIGQVRLTRTSAGALSIPAGNVLVDVAGVKYLVTDSVATSASEVLINVEAPEAGLAGNRPADRVWFPDSAATWSDGQTGLRLRNPQPLVGGNEAETDQEFRQRIAARWQAQRRGTAAAIRYAAMLPEVRRASVSEQRIRPHLGGWVDLYVTDGSDGYNGLLGERVRRAVDSDARAAGIVVNVWGADVVNVPVGLKVVLRAGGSADAVGRARDAVIALLNSLAIGEGLTRSRISAAVFSADSSIADVAVLAPGGDLVASPRQLLRTTVESVTIQ
ncbi:hypothetical protein GC173_11360 [bacterium]|nr:hypothetical protein [bacterium]